jgi:IS6 family transposase
VLLSARRDAAAARRFFTRALLGALEVEPSEVFTDAAPVDGGVLGELLPTT